MTVGMIGLGHLGRAIAGRLESQGEQLIVWNRTPEKHRGLHAQVALSPADLADRADITLVCLFDSAAVQEVLESEHGVLKGRCRGKLIVDMTTNHFDAVERLYHLCAEAGARYVEAPVLGSVVPASQGKLTILVSGEQSAYEEALPILQKLGEKIYYLVQPGRATRMKLVNNLVLGVFMATVAEATAAAEAVGLSRQQALDILAAGAGQSAVLNAKRSKLLDGDFSPHFSVATIHKDLVIVADLFAHYGMNEIMGPAARAAFGAAATAGLAEMDLSAVFKLYTPTRPSD